MEENNNNNAMLSIEDEKEEIKNIILSQAAERDKATQIKFLLDEYVKS